MDTSQLEELVGQLADRVRQLEDDPDKTNWPTAAEKAALAGTYGTPEAANKFVTDSDPRFGLLAPTGDVTVTGGYGVLRVEYYEIAANKFLELGAGAIMEVS